MACCILAAYLMALARARVRGWAVRLRLVRAPEPQSGPMRFRATG